MAHRLDAVDHHVGAIGQWDVEVSAAHEMGVGVAAGLAQRADGHEHARAGEVTGVDGHSYPCGGAGCVAHRGEAGIQSLAGGADGTHQLEGRRGGELAGEVEAFTKAR